MDACLIVVRQYELCISFGIGIYGTSCFETVLVSHITFHQSVRYSCKALVIEDAFIIFPGGEH